MTLSNHLRFYCTVMLLLGTSSLGLAQTIITTDVTWSSNQVLNQPVIVDNGGTLRIKAGVEVEVAYVDANSDTCGDVYLEVNGRLVLEGLACDPVVFKPAGPIQNGAKHWKGIFIDSGQLHDSLFHFEIQYADSGLWIGSPTLVTGAIVNHCTGGITVDNGVNVTLDQAQIYDNFGTGIANYGGNLTASNLHSYRNEKFGLASHGGSLSLEYAEIDSNQWGGVYLGSGTTTISNSSITDNDGAGFEVSEWILDSDFNAPGTKSTNPIVNVNGNNIHDNAATRTKISNEELRKFMALPQPWGDCVGGYPQLSLNQCNTSAYFEVPFGSFDSLVPELAHKVRRSPSRHYPMVYYLERGYDLSTLSTHFTGNNGVNCLVSTTVKYVLAPGTFVVPGYHDYYRWRTCNLTSQTVQRPTLMDGFYTMKAGDFEVSSTVGSAQNLDFSGNYWGQTSGISGLVHDVNAINIDYAGFLNTPAVNASAVFSNGFPIVDLGADTTLCDNLLLMLDAGNSASSFLWSGGATSQVLDSINAPGVYHVTVTNACGSSNDSILVSHLLSPIVAINGNSALCLGDTLQLTATGADTYQWNAGLGTASSISVAPTQGTSYSVMGMAANGCQNMDSISIAVDSLPVVMASSNQAICTGDTTFLTASGATSYTWDNNAGNGTMVAVAPMASTTYTTSGTDGNGCEGSASVTVTVDTLPVVFTNPNLSICLGDTAALNGFGALNYAWNNGAGIGAVVNVAPLVSTNYVVTGTDGNGCIGSDSITVTVDSLPVAFAGPPIGICAGDSAILTAVGNSTYNYAWDNGAGNGMMIPIYPLAPLTYTLTITDGNGCQTMDSLVVSIDSVPVIMVDSNFSICLGDSAVLNASGASTYDWDNGIGSGAMVTVVPLVTTTYTVTGRDGNFCEDTATVTVAVDALPMVTASPDLNLCLNDTAALTVTGADTYSWDNGLGMGAAVIIAPVSNTLYTVVGTDINGCQGTDSVFVSVTTVDTSVSQTADILQSNAGNATYQWLSCEGMGFTQIPGASDSSFQVVQTGSYAVAVTQNGCVDTSGCHTVVVVGMKEEIQALDILLYPNPAQNRVVVDLGEHPVDADIRVINSLGQVVRSVSLEDERQTSISLQGLSIGIYYVQIHSGEREQVVKLIKKD